MEVDNKEENGAYVGKITTYINKKCTECHTLKKMNIEHLWNDSGWGKQKYSGRNLS